MQVDELAPDAFPLWWEAIYRAFKFEAKEEEDANHAAQLVLVLPITRVRDTEWGNHRARNSTRVC